MPHYPVVLCSSRTLRFVLFNSFDLVGYFFTWTCPIGLCTAPRPAWPVGFDRSEGTSYNIVSLVCRPHIQVGRPRDRAPPELPPVSPSPTDTVHPLSGPIAYYAPPLSWRCRRERLVVQVFITPWGLRPDLCVHVQLLGLWYSIRYSISPTKKLHIKSFVVILVTSCFCVCIFSLHIFWRFLLC